MHKAAMDAINAIALSAQVHSQHVEYQTFRVKIKNALAEVADASSTCSKF